MTLKKLIGIGLYGLIIAVFAYFGISGFVLGGNSTVSFFTLIFYICSAISGIVGLIAVLKDENSLTSLRMSNSAFGFLGATFMFYSIFKLVAEISQEEKVSAMTIILLVLSFIYTISLSVGSSYVSKYVLGKNGDTIKQTNPKAYEKLQAMSQKEIAKKRIASLLSFILIIPLMVLMYKNNLSNTRVLIFFIGVICISLAGIAFLEIDRFF